MSISVKQANAYAALVRRLEMTVARQRMTLEQTELQLEAARGQLEATRQLDLVEVGKAQKAR